MAEKNPDYMLPLDNSDRAEYILVPFSNIIRSINQPICIFMLQHPEEFSLEEYPKLSEFIIDGKIDGDKLYNEVSRIPNRFLISYLKGDLKLEEKKEYTRIIEGIRLRYDIFQSYHTRMEAALARISQSGLAKEIWIQDEYLEQDKSMQNFIDRLFDRNLIHKDCYIERALCNTYLAINNIPRITTVYFEEIAEAIWILKNTEPKILEGKAFFVSTGPCVNGYNDLEDTAKQIDELNKLAVKKKVQINYFFPYQYGIFGGE